MVAEYSSLFRAGLTPRTNVFDPSDVEVQDAQHNRLSIMSRLRTSVPRRLSTVFSPAKTGSPKPRGHRPNLSLDTHFNRAPVRAEDSFLSFSATADTYALPSSGIAPVDTPFPRRRTEGSLPLISRFSPDTPDMADTPFTANTPYSAELASAPSPVQRGHRAPPPTPARTPVYRSVSSPPVFTSPFGDRKDTDSSSPPSPLHTPTSAARRREPSYLWAQHPFVADYEESKRLHPYAVAL